MEQTVPVATLSMSMKWVIGNSPLFCRLLTVCVCSYFIILKGCRRSVSKDGNIINKESQSLFCDSIRPGRGAYSAKSKTA